MEVKRNNFFHKKITFATSLSLLIITFFIAMYQSTMKNPDYDAYWLIATGRYVMEHHTFPKINPWINDANLGIVIQQPLCALFNYFWASISNGPGSLWQLATLMNFAMIMAMFHLCKKMKYSYPATFLSIAIAETCCIIAGLNTTRPYQFTMTMSCLLIINLEMAKRNKSYRHAVITIILLTLWQANYQMASLIAIPLFISCYVAGELCTKIYIYLKEHDKKIFKTSDFLKGISLYIIWAICSLMNPYGLDGALYLYHSKDAMVLCKMIISELQPYSLNSKQSFFIIFVLMMYLMLYGKQFYKHFEKTFLVCGCVLAAVMSIRNFWMVIVASFFVIPPFLEILFEKLEEYMIAKQESQSNALEIEKTLPPDSSKSNAQKRIIMYIYAGALFASIACSVLTFNSQALSINKTKNLLEEIQKLPDDANIFTTFATGSLAEYAGKHIYIDARPEIFSPAITGGEDRLFEWIMLYYSDASAMDEYMQKHSYDYYIINPFDVTYNYLTFTGKGEVIYMDYVNGICIMKQVNS